MGNNNSINKVNFEYIQKCINYGSEKILLINTLDYGKQECLIKNSIHALKEEEILNNCLKNNRVIKIIIYGENCTDNKVIVKYNQLYKLGFVNLYVYIGGLFEWLLNINNGRKQAWSTLIARDMLDQGLDFNSAVKVLSATPLIAPLYYIMAGPNNLQVF
jgi:hypothetical protein